MPFARRAGVRLFYSDSGSGAPVLLHTGGAGDHRMWELAGYVGSLTAEGHRVLNLDHRGHGRSDKPTDPAAHELREYVDDVVAVLDDAQVERATLVGYSFGTRVALGVAARHADRVSGVFGLGTLLPRDFDPQLRREDSAEIRAIGIEAVIAEMAASQLPPAPSWFLENLASTETEMFALLLDGLATDTREWADLERARCPVQLIWGEKEAATEPTDQVLVLDGLTHLQVFWRSDLITPHLTEFLGREGIQATKR